MICKWLSTKALGLARGWWTLMAMVCLVLALAWALGALAPSTSTETKLAQNQAGAAIASGRDAVATIGAQSAAEAATDAITRENDHAIRNAEGAAAPVPPAVAAAGRAGLCQRAAYSRSEQCMQFTPAAALERKGAGR